MLTFILLSCNQEILTYAALNHNAHTSFQVEPSVELYISEIKSYISDIKSYIMSNELTNGLSVLHDNNMNEHDRLHKHRGRLIKSSNSNHMTDYLWMRTAVEAIDTKNTQFSVDPVFYVVGACPSTFTPMQSVMFVYDKDQKSVDFWWIKPETKSTDKLEEATMNLNYKGKWKNDPGSSKTVFKPVSDLFNKKQSHNHVSFDILTPDEGEDQTVRAVIKISDKEDKKIIDILHVYLIWAEDWTTNPFAFSKFIKGRIVYRHENDPSGFYAQEYRINDGVFEFKDDISERFEDIFNDGASKIKDLYEWVD